MRSASNNRPALAVTSVRIEREKLAALREIASRNRRNVSQQINWLIDRNIADEGTADNTKAAA